MRHLLLRLGWRWRQARPTLSKRDPVFHVHEADVDLNLSIGTAWMRRGRHMAIPTPPFGFSSPARGMNEGQPVKGFLSALLYPFKAYPYTLLVISALSATLVPLNATKAETQVVCRFPVFDAIKSARKPDLSGYGLRPINVLYQRTLWGGKKASHDDLPPKDVVSDLARKSAANGVITVLDIEHWPLHHVADTEIENSLARYLQVVTWFRAAAPGLPIGYYGNPPIRDYWRAVKGAGTPEYRAWQGDNTRLIPLATKVDALYPSLYTFYADPSGWVSYATENLREARRLAGGKPVYAFIWPRYHESNKLIGGKEIPASFWRMQLETVRRKADGAVIWSASWETWDDNAPWWQETKRFMSSLCAGGTRKR